MTNNARMMTVCVLGSLAATGLGLYAVTRGWRESVGNASPLQSDVSPTTGAEIATWSIGSILVSFAATLALLATKGLARRLVAVGILASGLGLGAAGVTGVMTDAGVWPVVTVVAAVLVLVGGVLAFRYAKQWPSMSARYDRSDARPPKRGDDHADPNAMWDALDRGEDPTKEPNRDA